MARTRLTARAMHAPIRHVIVWPRSPVVYASRRRVSGRVALQLEMSQTFFIQIFVRITKTRKISPTFFHLELGGLLEPEVQLALLEVEDIDQGLSALLRLSFTTSRDIGPRGRRRRPVAGTKAWTENFTRLQDGGLTGARVISGDETGSMSALSPVPWV